MGVVSAFGRLVKNIMHVITFGPVKASESIECNPQIVGLQFDEVIEEKAKTAKRIRDALGVLSVPALIGAYALLSHRQHKRNPEDTTLPNLAQLRQGIRTLATPNPRTGERWLVIDAKASGARLGLGMGVWPEYEHHPPVPGAAGRLRVWRGRSARGLVRLACLWYENRGIDHE